jgi:hypothetical protein
MLIGVAGWLVCGAILGFVVGKLIDLRGDDPRFGIAVAALGGAAGGGLYSLINHSPVIPFNFWSLVFAASVAIVGVIVWHVIRHRSPYARQTVRRSY